MCQSSTYCVGQKQNNEYVAISEEINLISGPPNILIANCWLLQIVKLPWLEHYKKRSACLYVGVFVRKYKEKY